MLLPGALPPLHPFLPSSEAERQLVGLIHEPLIRIDREGRLGTALAEQWSWHQDMTCWFATPAEADQAEAAVKGQPVEKRATWDLESVRREGLSLTLRFTHPDSRVADDVLAVLETQQPQRLTFLRISSAPSQRAAILAFAAHADQVATIKRVWFDDDGSCEMVTTRSGLQAQQMLIDWLKPRTPMMPDITPMAELAGLLEPVLDFRLKVEARWHDGSAITAADVRATVDYVLPRPWPLFGRDAFRHIQSITQPAPGVVRVVYRKRHGPTLAAWTELPILPESWLKNHPQDFGSTPPPGAGAWSVTDHEPGKMTLKKDSAEPTPALQVLAATSPLQARIGLATSSFDILWPTESSRSWLKSDAMLELLNTPPHNQLMLVWQTESISDVAVRKALSLALDRESLRHQMPGGQARLHDSFFISGRWFSKPATPVISDLKAAEHLLSQSGWLRDVSGDLKKAGQLMELRLLIPEGNADRRRLALALGAAWAQLGVRVQISSSAPDRYVGDLRQGRFDVALVGGELSPGWDVLPLWHSSQSQGRGLNLSRVEDAQLDLLLEALDAEFDPLQVPRRAAAVESRLTELRPALPLFTDVVEMMVRSARFPGLAGLDSSRGITLRELLPATTLQSRPSLKLEMLAPK